MFLTTAAGGLNVHSHSILCMVLLHTLVLPFTEYNTLPISHGYVSPQNIQNTPIARSRNCCAVYNIVLHCAAKILVFVNHLYINRLQENTITHFIR